MASLETAVQNNGQSIEIQRYAPQPPDFPIHRTEPAYLKTAWLKVK